MLKLDDFFHLPQLDALVEQLVADGPGLIVVAGLDPRPQVEPAPGDGFLPSGRTAIFRILMQEVLAASQSGRAIVVTEDQTVVRVPRQLWGRIALSLVEPPLTYEGQIASAIGRRPDLLVIDRLCAETAPAALEAARKGLRVLSQMDTVFCGANVARCLRDWGASQEQLRGVTWVVAVQRMAALCPRCKQPMPPGSEQWTELRRRYPDLASETFFQSPGCVDCNGTGRRGDVAVFDIFRADAGAPDPLEQPSLLSLQEYVSHLAVLGYLSPGDVLRLEANQLHRAYTLLVASERALADATGAMARKLAELEAANRVLEQRTEALISLQDISQTLIASTDLDDLGARVCRHACDLCGAERAILYFVRSDDKAEVLSMSGWDAAFLHQQVDTAQLFGTNAGDGAGPRPFVGHPPGVLSPRPDGRLPKSQARMAGLRVPLIAQDRRVGLMVVQTNQKWSFTPGEVALLQTFANQAALAIQRAGLIEQLREKIAQLQAAQAELVQKERMEKELELARQVQQSVLPRVFPRVPGYTFAVRNEPARQVGGDFYDVFALDEDHFGLVVADVSGKGMPAALYMALTRSLLLAEARREPSPHAVLSNVNRLLLELGEANMFVTVFYGAVERVTRRLTYARAGHDRPLLMREGTVQPLGGTGAFLGCLEEGALRLSEEQIDLAPGDRLVLYTDGLTDVLAPDGEIFALGRLQALLQSCASLDPADMCAATFAELYAYQGNTEQFDDMTMLVVGVE